MKSRPISWNGASFRVPANWELALYRFPDNRTTRIEIEDEFSVRLEAEWTRPPSPIESDRLRRRFDKACRRAARGAVRSDSIVDLPQGWLATRYTFPSTPGAVAENSAPSLVAATGMVKDSTLCVSLLLHFGPRDPEPPEATTLMIGESWRDALGDRVPWQAYDVDLAVPRGFSLADTRFETGAKLMVFQTRGRRLFVWTFSCADVILRQSLSLREWVAAYLNQSRRFRRVVFRGEADGIAVKRQPPFAVHRDELARWCFRYVAGCRHRPETNQVVAWVFQHRRRDDVGLIDFLSQ